jgi:hypothetical protein
LAPTAGSKSKPRGGNEEAFVAARDLLVLCWSSLCLGTRSSITGFLDFVHLPKLKIQGNTTFRKQLQGLRLALSKGPNRVGVTSTHLREETDPVSETSCFLIFRIQMDKVHKPSTPECYISASESFSFCGALFLRNVGGVLPDCIAAHPGWNHC